MSGLRGQLLEVLVEPGLAPDDLRRRMLDALEQPQPSPRMTYDEFLAWADEDTHAEWVDGEVRIAWLWQRPTVLAALRELRLV
jgi:hypothetical protein